MQVCTRSKCIQRRNAQACAPHLPARRRFPPCNGLACVGMHENPRKRAPGGLQVAGQSTCRSNRKTTETCRRSTENVVGEQICQPRHTCVFTGRFSAGVQSQGPPTRFRARTDTNSVSIVAAVDVVVVVVVVVAEITLFVFVADTVASF